MFRTIALLLLGIQTADAALITLDARDYAIGTNLSHAAEGLTVQRLGWPTSTLGDPRMPPMRTDVYATRCGYTCEDPNGSSFGISAILQDGYLECMVGSRGCPQGDNNALEFTFDNLTDSVSMLISFTMDAPGYIAYDINGNVIAQCRGLSSCSSIVPTPSRGGPQCSTSTGRRAISTASSRAALRAWVSFRASATTGCPSQAPW